MIVDIPNTAIAWLAHGERGASSEAIFSYLTGVPVSSRLSYPLDAGDLRRCRRLLAAVPEFAARLPEMAKVSPQWAVLVEHWSELCELADSNSKDAYVLMRHLVDGKRASRG